MELEVGGWRMEWNHPWFIEANWSLTKLKTTRPAETYGDNKLKTTQPVEVYGDNQT